MVQIGNDVAWLWIALEPINRTVLGVHISRDRTMIVAEAFLKTLKKIYGKHPVYSGRGTWYPQACRNSCNLLHVYNWIRLFVLMHNFMISIKPRSYKVWEGGDVQS